MSEPKTTIDLPFSPEDVRIGRNLGNAIAGYRDGDFKRSAEGMVDAVRAFQAAAAEIDRLRAELKARTGMTDLDADFYRDKAVIIAERDRLRAENASLMEERDKLIVENHDLAHRVAEAESLQGGWGGLQPGNVKEIHIGGMTLGGEPTPGPPKETEG